MRADRLLSLAPPHLHLLTASASKTCDFAWSLQRIPEKDAVVRVVRGSKSRTLDDLFDEMAAALQFPYYFGENWAALDECLADLEWLPGAAYVLFITDSEQLLDRDPVGELRALLQVLQRAARHWSGPDRPGTPPKPFHAVFQCSNENVGAFLERLGEHALALERMKTEG
jgi:Barstar (barnase inhibitor)